MVWVVNENSNTVVAEWDDPTVTNLGTGMAVDMFVGDATEAGGLVKFNAKFQIGYAEENTNWVTASPRLSLPIASGNPSRMVGTGTGYGGSVYKTFRSFSETVLESGLITDNGGTLRHITSATTDDDGTIYLGALSNVYTLNLGTRQATLYAENVGSTAVKWPLTGLAWHDDTLYASGGPGTEYFYSVTDSSHTEIGQTFTDLDLHGDHRVLGLESHDGVLYFTADSAVPEDRLPLFGTIDVSTGVGTDVLQNSGVPIGEEGYMATLFSYNGDLYTVLRNSYPQLIMKFIFLSLGAAQPIYELRHNFSSSFIVGDQIYFISDASGLFSTDFSTPPISSIDFRGETYTTAIGQVEQEGNLIQVNIEKMQCNTSPVLLSISGSYKK